MKIDWLPNVRINSADVWFEGHWWHVVGSGHGFYKIERSSGPWYRRRKHTRNVRGDQVF